VAISGMGEAVAVWKDNDDRPSDSEASIFVSRSTAATPAFSAAELVETGDAGPAYGHNVAAGEAGQTLVSWVYYDRSNLSIAYLYARRGSAGTLGPQETVAEAYDFDGNGPVGGPVPTIDG